MNVSIPEKYLPIGSVVLLKDGEKRVMITGFGFIDTNNDDIEVIYDYVGVLYPEGLLSTDQNLVFNHDKIDKIFALGYSDDEDKEFRKRIRLIDEEFKNTEN